MRYSMRVLVLLPLSLLPTQLSFAADANGYTARYERNIAGAPSCDAVITSTDDPDWGKLNDGGYRVICLAPGDYSSKGLLHLSANGAPGFERWLRYYSPTDSGKHPVHQNSGERARVQGLVFQGSDYWIIDRISFTSTQQHARAYEHNGNKTENIIFNKILSENSGYNPIFVFEATNNMTVQNSVIRNSQKLIGTDVVAIAMEWNAQNTRIVNNEIYDIASHPIQINFGVNYGGTVIENNDLYVSSAQYTDCNGNYTSSGSCAAAEQIISIKDGGTASNPVQIIHNRIWGARRTDPNVCCTITGGDGIGLNSGPGADTEYVLIQNNVLMDNEYGIAIPWFGGGRNSFIGNVMYKHSGKAFALLGNGDASEIYFNTIIEAASWADIGGGDSDLDARCNLVINSGGNSGGTPAGSAVVENNAFYGTPALSHNGSNTLGKNLATRQSGSNYSANDYVVPSTTNGFAYRAMQGGRSGDAGVTFCESLGCTVQDGGVVWQAALGPYTFKRKLQTISGGETVRIPYAKPHAAASHSQGCVSNPGSRAGIGISDDLLL